jgi:hypothetical protein
MPIRRMRAAGCAYAATGQEAITLPNAAMKSRRRMSSSHSRRTIALQTSTPRQRAASKIERGAIGLAAHGLGAIRAFIGWYKPPDRVLPSML